MLTTQLESFTEVLPELKPLLPTHWEELALNKDKVKLDPQYNIYLARDAAGEVMFVTLRELGQLVGYFIGFVAPGLHYKTCLTLHGDIFYVWPANRGGGGGFVLFNFVKAEAKRRGVQRVFAGTKMHKDCAWMFERMGWDECERTFTLWLGD